ncbi:unnamed protein product, partial [Ixodes persulcatus]
MVRTVKDLLAKTKDPYLALLVYRDTPGVSEWSPAQLLMGRRLQTTVPKLEEALIPRSPPRTLFHQRDSSAQRRQAQDYNKRHAARPLRPLSPGEEVWLADVPGAARVLGPARRPRSYVVQTPTGILERNR